MPTFQPAKCRDLMAMGADIEEEKERLLLNVGDSSIFVSMPLSDPASGYPVRGRRSKTGLPLSFRSQSCLSHRLQFELLVFAWDSRAFSTLLTGASKTTKTFVLFFTLILLLSLICRVSTS